MQSIARATKSHLRLDPNIQFSSEFSGLNDRVKLISFNSNPVKVKILRKLIEYQNMDLLGGVVDNRAGKPPSDRANFYSGGVAGLKRPDIDASEAVT
jgi:hypothetical protein